MRFEGVFEFVQTSYRKGCLSLNKLKNTLKSKPTFCKQLLQMNFIRIYFNILFPQIQRLMLNLRNLLKKLDNICFE